MVSRYAETTAALQKQSNAAHLDARNISSRIQDRNPNPTLRDPNFSVKLKKPNIGPPPSMGDLFQGDNTNSTISHLNEQAEEWANKYFPEVTGGLKSLPEEWLCGVISQLKPYGKDKTVFELVWHAARDRAYRTSSTETKTLEASFSARGFSLPPGALIDALAQSEARATAAILAVNVEEAIKDADIKLELLKFAEEQAIRLKLGVMQSLADFYRQWISIPDNDIRRAAVRAQAQASLYGALSTYHNVEIGFQELTLRAAQMDAGIDIDVDRNRISASNIDGSRNSALGTAVSAFANLAGNAAQAGGTLTAEIEAL